jgi:hypothetical protein
MISSTFQNGNREVTVTIGGETVWKKDSMARVYFDLQFQGAKLDPIEKFYEVVSGTTQDNTIVAAGRTFGYKLGICCDSNSKKKEAVAAVTELVNQL